MLLLQRSAEESDSLRDALAQRDEELVVLRRDNERLRSEHDSAGAENSRAIINMEEENAVCMISCPASNFQFRKKYYKS